VASGIVPTGAAWSWGASFPQGDAVELEIDRIGIFRNRIVIA
jgi:hypothetical protein